MTLERPWASSFYRIKMDNSLDNWTDERRHEYLRSVVRRLHAIKLLHDATLKGTETDPYAVSDEVRRAVSELEAVMGSLEPN